MVDDLRPLADPVSKDEFQFTSCFLFPASDRDQHSFNVGRFWKHTHYRRAVGIDRRFSVDTKFSPHRGNLDFIPGVDSAVIPRGEHLKGTASLQKRNTPLRFQQTYDHSFHFPNKIRNGLTIRKPLASPTSVCVVPTLNWIALTATSVLFPRSSGQLACPDCKAKAIDLLYVSLGI